LHQKNDLIQMNNLYSRQDTEGILLRISRLRADAQRQGRKMTAEEYAIMQWKHFDHHLRQFAA